MSSNKENYFGDICFLINDSYGKYLKKKFKFQNQPIFLLISKKFCFRTRLLSQVR